MTVLLWIFIVLLVLIGGVLIAAMMRPNDFRYVRSATMNAPPSRVFDFINDMHKFNSWNPFLKMDPSSDVVYSGPSAGKGAAYKWESKKMGAGRMEIVDTTAPSRVLIDLEFFKPFPGKNVVEFTIVPKGSLTEVTWAMSGKNAFVPKLMGLFMSMDKMIGATFDSGLADLKAKAEA
jgi:hypothetical protein